MTTQTQDGEPVLLRVTHKLYMDENTNKYAGRH